MELILTISVLLLNKSCPSKLAVKYDIVHMRDQSFLKHPYTSLALYQKPTPKQVLAHENFTPKQVLLHC